MIILYADMSILYADTIILQADMIILYADMFILMLPHVFIPAFICCFHHSVIEGMFSRRLEYMASSLAPCMRSCSVTRQMVYACIADGALIAGVEVCLTIDVVSTSKSCSGVLTKGCSVVLSKGCSGVLTKATQLQCIVQVLVNYCAMEKDTEAQSVQPGCWSLLHARLIQMDSEWHMKLSNHSKLSKIPTVSKKTDSFQTFETFVGLQKTHCNLAASMC